MQKSKAKTARITLYNELREVPGIYTLEASFSDTVDGIQYTPDLLKSIGRDMCKALIPYCGLNVLFTIPRKDIEAPTEK
jgi:hypothetical protein